MSRTRGNAMAPGQGATSPRGIPRRGWMQILRRTVREASEDHVTLVSAGVAFFGLLAIFPALAALVSLYGLVADPNSVESTLRSIDAVPQAARDLLGRQLQEVASSSNGALGVGLAGSVLLALWSASKGMKALMTAMNIAYDEDEERGFLKLNLEAYALTTGAIVFLILALAVIAGIPAVLGTVSLGGPLRVALVLLPWIVLVGVLVAGFALLYRYGPSRASARWRWISPGAAAAAALWVIASVAFSFYVSSFGSYNETYGSLGTVVILLMWFYLSALIAILGAELNAEVEQQTERDTTTGSPEPIGTRGAAAADALPWER